MAFTPGFTGSVLDRVEAERLDPAIVPRLVAEGDALYLAMPDYEPATDDASLAWTALDAAIPADELVLLGRIDGRPRFTRLPGDIQPARRTPAVMALIDSLPPSDAATYGVARSLLDWHARHRFCAFCGNPSTPMRAGWARHCPACGTEHYPRTDPVVIMLAEYRRGDIAQVLVGRQPIFPPGRFSALAGFLEVGEAIEGAVARELFEEAGVRAGRIRYVASQPWPFPSQLMIACIAEVDDPTITLDTNELEDAKWVTRADVLAALAGEDGAPFLAPPSYAIAHTLLRAWAEGA
ncbi:NAD(+) diphosphatase [Sphingomonas sp. BIUV-7]|uniref:NAD(+) diphosphatase n=1 Tax=Sphingomonas natans TaxID=3063330 RepID=A0ABT8YEV7_9SPHN|nr:NAD(+) diphosphatase [Sphingomonas sp. BIUV-7]MDO6416869.1 NAD(+) diphosphatase [Sphingomonas sp. BIUV-7]